MLQNQPTPSTGNPDNSKTASTQQLAAKISTHKQSETYQQSHAETLKQQQQLRLYTSEKNVTLNPYQ